MERSDLRIEYFFSGKGCKMAAQKKSSQFFGNGATIRIGREMLCLPFALKKNYVSLWNPGFIKFQQDQKFVPWIGEQPYTEMLFWQFSNIIIYVKIVGNIPDQHLNVSLFSNPGDTVQILVQSMG